MLNAKELFIGQPLIALAESPFAQVFWQDTREPKAGWRRAY